MKMNRILQAVATGCFILLSFAPWCLYSDGDQLLVGMTLVRNASVIGAFCLDGSLPGYHLHRGFGAGARNWLLQFEGGGWCNSIQSCLDRAQTHRGSTRYMSKLEVFSGILSNNASLNPDFYNWNRVKIRYCDGASFSGDAVFDNGTSLLYFRGQRIWRAIIHDLLPKGLGQARKALLSGCSAGGLASFLHCDNFSSYLPRNASVKCLSDAGFFLDERDITLNHTARSVYEDLITLQGISRNLDKNCTSSHYYPVQCFFPQYVLAYTKTPFFVLNTAYDVYQFHHNLVPPSADPRGHWNHCKLNPSACTAEQINILQGFRKDMLAALSFFYHNSTRGGMFINSCFAHCQSESQDTWFADDSPRINNKVCELIFVFPHVFNLFLNFFPISPTIFQRLKERNREQLLQINLQVQPASALDIIYTQSNPNPTQEIPVMTRCMNSLDNFFQTIADAVGDWYFGRGRRNKQIDCAYPCDNTCHNLIG